MRLIDNRGYVKIKYNGKMVWEHRLIWFLEYGYWPDVVDHINGNKSDNRLCNLRDVSKGENNHARPVRADSSTGHKGVFKNGSGYMARISKNGKSFYLGTFKTVEEASAAYLQKADEIYPIKALEKEYGNK